MLLTIFVRLTHKFYGLGVVCLKHCAFFHTQFFRKRVFNPNSETNLTLFSHNVLGLIVRLRLKKILY